MAYQYTLQMNEVPDNGVERGIKLSSTEIREGDKFLCIADVGMNGNPSDISYIKGKVYTSEKDGCITNESCNTYHRWFDSWTEYFQRYEDKGEEYYGCKPDRDYFQSVQGEYGCSCQAKHDGECSDNKADKFDDSIKIMQTFSNLSNLLVYKNTLYGNSGLTPINVFSKTDAQTGLLQRLDDKIARVKNSPELRKNDMADIIGYLVLICVSKGWTTFDEFKD